MKSANVRAAPATDAKIVAKLAVDQAVDVTGRSPAANGCASPSKARPVSSAAS